jgi:hypothetical protein
MPPHSLQLFEANKVCVVLRWPFPHLSLPPLTGLRAYHHLFPHHPAIIQQLYCSFVLGWPSHRRPGTSWQPHYIPLILHPTDPTLTCSTPRIFGRNGWSLGSRTKSRQTTPAAGPDMQHTSISKPDRSPPTQLSFRLGIRNLGGPRNCQCNTDHPHTSTH